MATASESSSSLSWFIKNEASAGILLIVATVLAMLAVNSPLHTYYDSLLSIPVAFQFGDFIIAKPSLLWINDGLMALFFFLVGLELKREVLAGELSNPKQILLPAVAAVGGMAAPALIYAYINRGDAIAMSGWAIPSATDIAFALGILALVGKGVPNALKLFLMTLAIVDDLGAIIIIALFYTEDLSVLSLVIAGTATFVLFLMNRRGVMSFSPYILVGLVLWVAVLKSGVHATLAGVIVALFIPYKRRRGSRHTQLEQLEHDLHVPVMLVILPIFAFANTGISFDGLSFSSLFEGIPLGIAAGLFIGNQVGVFGLSWLTIKLGLASLPENVRWIQLYGVSILCGVGFTMSLFIASLAFDHDLPGYAINDRLGILVGSTLSAIVGYVLLRMTRREPAPAAS